MESTKRPRSPSFDKEVETSYKKLRTVKLHEADLEKKIKSIEEKIEQLYCERGRYNKALRSITKKDGPLEQALVPYSRSSTLAFMKRMRSFLPRELRDMVYEQLWMHMARRQMHFWNVMEGILFWQKCPDNPCQCFRHRKLPTFLDSAFVGSEAKLEIVESLYKSGVLHKPLELNPDLLQLKLFICQDTFNVGVNPATLLRQISISVKTEKCLEDEYDAPYTGKWMLEELFGPLLRIVNKSGFQLRIVLSQRHVRLNVLEEFLDVLRPLVEAFEKEGANVNVIFRFRHGSTTNRMHERALTDALATPDGDWKKDMTQWLEDQSCIMPYHRDYLHENEPDYAPSEYYDTEYYDTEDEHDGNSTGDPWGNYVFDNPWDYTGAYSLGYSEHEDYW